MTPTDPRPMPPPIGTPIQVVIQGGEGPAGLPAGIYAGVVTGREDSHGRLEVMVFASGMGLPRCLVRRAHRHDDGVYGTYWQPIPEEHS